MKPEILLLANEEETSRQRQRLQLDDIHLSGLDVKYVYLKSLNSHAAETSGGFTQILRDLSLLKSLANRSTIIWCFPVTRWRSALIFYFLRWFCGPRRVGLMYIKPLPMSQASVADKRRKSTGVMKEGYLETTFNWCLRKVRVFSIEFDFIIISGDRCLRFLRGKVKNIDHVAQLRVFSTNYLDYINYSKKNSCRKPTRACRGVFIDQALPLHPDYIRGAVPLKDYYEEILKILELIERNTISKIDISLHPRVRRSDLELGDRNIISSSSLVASFDYDYCVTLFSTACDFWIYQKKPVLVIDPDIVKDKFPQIQGLAEEIDKAPITLGSLGFSLNDFILTSDETDSYVRNYSYVPGANSSIWNSVSNYLASS